jgi:hypothetical protein
VIAPDDDLVYGILHTLFPLIKTKFIRALNKIGVLLGRLVINLTPVHVFPSPCQGEGTEG